MNNSLNKEEQIILENVMKKLHRKIYSDEIETDDLIQLIYDKFVKKSAQSYNSDDDSSDDLDDDSNDELNKSTQSYNYSDDSDDSDDDYMMN